MKNVYNSCMGLIFAVNDPRGFRVICTDEIWINKILVKRPWLDGWQDLIISTIEKPDMPIFSDALHKDRSVYYRKIEGYNKGRYLKVVVKFNKKNKGRVITVLTTSSAKKGEFRIWPLSNP